MNKQPCPLHCTRHQVARGRPTQTLSNEGTLWPRVLNPTRYVIHTLYVPDHEKWSHFNSAHARFIHLWLCFASNRHTGTDSAFPLPGRSALLSHSLLSSTSVAANLQPHSGLYDGEEEKITGSGSRDQWWLSMLRHKHSVCKTKPKSWNYLYGAFILHHGTFIHSSWWSVSLGLGWVRVS